ncbi:UNVERIFIED_CONTAM: hypothetical protein Scaly_0680300 [Sesamum calycinum]|uniref:DDE Tnp4 domain-containing protein n=1 Tax=Sesamum calycinum TaxID=2727403 RepID=A0AAW2R5Y9_9LAMI
MLRLSLILLARPLPVDDECQDSRWRWCKGCLGALDGTHIEARVPDSDKGSYRNRKGQISTKVPPMVVYCVMLYIDLRALKFQGYHLKEWDRGNGGPQSPHELFNLRHASARNVIERTFGLLKTRWGILRSSSYYPIRVQNQIIVACCLLHNFVRMEMPDDPLEGELSDEVDMPVDHGIEVVSTLDAIPQWTSWRDALAIDMYTEWTRRR